MATARMPKRAVAEAGEEQGEDGGCWAEPGGDHGEEFDVAHAEAFLVTDQKVKPADSEQEKRGEDGPHDRSQHFPRDPRAKIRSRIGRRDSHINYAQSDAGQGEGVGETHGFCVHDGEAEEQEAEDGGADGFDGEAEAQIAEQEQRGGGEFDRGVAPGDGLAAMAAAAAEKNPAEDGDVVDGADGCARTAGSASAGGRWIRGAAGGRCRR